MNEMKKMRTVGARKNIMVAKMPLIEITCRLSTIFNEDGVRNILLEAVNDSFNYDGLLVSYDTEENLFIVIVSNLKYKSIAELYVPDERDNILNKLIYRSPRFYRFADGSKFSAEELEVIKAHKEDDSNMGKLMNKMLNELIKRNIYNYPI